MRRDNRSRAHWQIPLPAGVPRSGCRCADDSLASSPLKPAAIEPKTPMEQAARVALLSLALLGGLSVSRAEDAASSYSLAFGPAVEITPSYPGARSQRTFALPDIEAQYHDWLYISGTDLLGVYAYNHDNTQAGAAIEWDFTERLAKD